jgi:hypothetical protein
MLATSVVQQINYFDFHPVRLRAVGVADYPNGNLFGSRQCKCTPGARNHSRGLFVLFLYCHSTNSGAVSPLPIVHHHVYIFSPLTSILSQLSSVHTFQPIYPFNIILPSTPLSLSGLYPWHISTNILYAFLIISCVLHIQPISTSLINRPNNIRWRT